MAMTEDSRALLQLLLGKGQTYSDIADLLGVGENEVRSRANAALREISDRDPDENVQLTDYLLGQADPIARADVARHLAGNPDDQELADTLAAQLRLLAPGASLPKPGRPGIAPARKSGRSRPEAGKEGAAKSRRDPRSLTVQQRRLIALLLGAALLIAVVVILITGVFSSGDSSNDSGNNPPPTSAILKPENGEKANGRVLFGFAGSNLAANLQLNDLEPTGKNQAYTTWMTGPKNIAYPINEAPVGKSRTISGQVQVNQGVICSIAEGVFTDVRVSRVTNAQMKAALDAASKANGGKGKLPGFVGKPVMRGPVQMPDKAKRQVLPICEAAANSAAAATGATGATGQ